MLPPAGISHALALPFHQEEAFPMAETNPRSTWSLIFASMLLFLMLQENLSIQGLILAQGTHCCRPSNTTVAAETSFFLKKKTWPENFCKGFPRGSPSSREGRESGGTPCTPCAGPVHLHGVCTGYCIPIGCGSVSGMVACHVCNAFQLPRTAVSCKLE